jgi:hypothetical protein
VTFFALLVLLQTPPPLVPVEASPAPSPYSPSAPRAEPVADVVDEPVTTALHFSPGSTFGLFFGLEVEQRLATQLTVFASAGGGPLGQFAFDAGLRLYPVQRAFESFFADLRVSSFVMTNGMALVGPMVELGYAWCFGGHFLLTVGAGAAMWLTARRAHAGAGFVFGAAITDASFFALPGFSEPPNGRVGVQPTLRITLGPGF